MSIPATENLDSKAGRPGFLRRFWAHLNRPSRSSFLAVSTVFFVGGVLFWGGFHTLVDISNTLEFCTTCHEMRDNVYQEYKQSVHYRNRSGIRVICSDCHVPRDWPHMMVRKMRFGLELWGKATGIVDTKEKFEAKRLEMAMYEWGRMKENNSRECRNCHAFDSMSPGLQRSEPYKIHMRSREEGKTCIDCHKGLSHRLPKGYNIVDQ